MANQEKTIETITSEYEKKIKDLEDKHSKETCAIKEEYEKKIKEQEDAHEKEIRSLISGRENEITRQKVEEEKAKSQQKSFFETTVENTKKLLGLKGEN